MNYRRLRELWYYYTGDSQVLDIRIVKDPKKVGDYVARYASRPCQLSDLPNREAIEAYQSLYGRRIAGSWGTGRCISFRPQKMPDTEQWEYLGSWSTVHDMAKSDDRASAILEAYHRGTTLEDGYSLYDIERFIDGAEVPFKGLVDIDPIPPPTLFST